MTCSHVPFQWLFTNFHICGAYVTLGIDCYTQLMSSNRISVSTRQPLHTQNIIFEVIHQEQHHRIHDRCCTPAVSRYNIFAPADLRQFFLGFTELSYFFTKLLFFTTKSCRFLPLSEIRPGSCIHGLHLRWNVAEIICM